MTVNVTTPLISYNYTGAGVYNFDFQVFSEDHLVVIHTVDGVESTKSKGNDYTVSFNPDSTGTVTTLFPVVGLDSLTIKRILPLAQNRPLVNGEKLDLELVERVFDEFMMVLQQQETVVVDPIASLYANLTSLLAVESNEANIALLVASLPEIQAAAATLTMTVDKMTLILSNAAELEGSNYKTVADAYAYALTKMQVGGELTLTLAAGVTITEDEQAVLDCDRIRVKIVGADKNTSIISINSTDDYQYYVTGRGFYATNVTFKTVTHNYLMVVENASHAVFDNCILTDATSTTAHPVRVLNSTKIKFLSTTIIGENSGMYIDGSDVFIGNIGGPTPRSEIEVKDTDALTFCIFAYGQSRITLDGLDLTHPVGHTGTSVEASSNTTINVQFVVFDGNEGTQYNPLKDTFGNNYSRIITV